PHHDGWTRQTKAKNAITIDGGKGQVARRWDADGRIVRFLHGEHYDYALADATRAYRGALTQCLRHVLHVRPGTFVIVDELEAPKPVTFEWWLHALDKMAVEASKRQVVIQRGKARLAVDFIEPAKLAFSQTDQFQPPPEQAYKRTRPYPNQWHLTCSTASKSRTAVFFTVLRPHRASDTDTLPTLRQIRQGSVVGASWKSGGLEHTVCFDATGVRHDGLTTDARLVAVARRAAKPSAASWLVVEGSQLKLGAATLLQASGATTAVWSHAERACRLDTDGPRVRVTVGLPDAQTVDIPSGRHAERREHPPQ
ncbi:heparinase II/III family protein, partial [bacterium]|nr:heparinase II/III family protein [bacterium]